ncbi:sigma-54-dependent Fis family transcriptional regulator [Nocardia australiensis]|uniref:sigma-54-dependent Fis family transcriptional regulator n=1 Tax=Nocardia australiensis TaxID=2887191 RepID=UPI001D156D3B|nr:GAF domain-containing protein [Nocardia australiensis]
MDTTTDSGTQVRRAREQFLADGSADQAAVDATVLDSWHRSLALRVQPDRIEVPFVREPDPDAPLAIAGLPVVRRLADDLAAQTVSVILTSADGVVLERVTSEPAIMHALDDVQLARGYSYAEEFVGTNGIGTALATGRPTFIHGGEHYLGTLGQLACAGTPIRDPISGKVVGVLDLTCWASRSDPLLLALARSAGGQIEDRMSALATETEAALLEAYLRQCRRYPSGVVAVGDDLVLMNQYLRRSLDTRDQNVVLEHAMDLRRLSGSGIGSGTAVNVLPSGRIAKSTVAEHISLRRNRIDIIVHVGIADDSTVHGGRRVPAPPTPGLAGRSSSWRRSCHQVERCCTDRDWVALDGEPGSGRTKLAEMVAHHIRPDRTIRVLRIGGRTTAEYLLTALTSATAEDDFDIVLADIDRLSTEIVESLSTVLQSCAGRGWIAATMNSANHSAITEALLLPFFMHTVTVPALRYRIEDLEDLVPHLLRELTHDADVRLSSSAFRQLARLPWPGNTMQLRRVLAETLTRQRSGVILADKLPPECHSLTRRTLTRLEALERDAIVRSLQDNAGDKLAAAQALGISRATMYRKIKEFGIA